MHKMDMEGKNILISGAAGFIPSTLTEFYLNLGAHVYGIDNFITGQYKNIAPLEKNTRFHFVEANIYEQSVFKHFKNIKFDYIFSMASPASPVDFKKIPLEIMRVNSEGTLVLLNLAKEHGARFLEASTSEVYGDPEIHPQTEDYVGHVNTIGPRSCYDESKRFAEALTMTFHQHYKVDTRIIRIFNTYGPKMRPDDGRVIPNFINQALENKDLTVYGKGEQTRSFCFVSDLVDGIHAVMMGHDSTPFNVGNPDEYTILETAELIISLLGSKSKIIYKELPIDDPKRRRPDISKLQKISSFRPKISFKDGLKETADYFRALKETN